MRLAEYMEKIVIHDESIDIRWWYMMKNDLDLFNQFNLFNSAWGHGAVRYHLKLADNVAIIRPYSTSHECFDWTAETTPCCRFVHVQSNYFATSVKQDILPQQYFAKLDTWPITSHEAQAHLHASFKPSNIENHQSILKTYSGYSPPCRSILVWHHKKLNN